MNLEQNKNRCKYSNFCVNQESMSRGQLNIACSSNNENIVNHSKSSVM